jgi:hypothetical protein
MAALPSGLPESVGDDEDLARFVFSSSQYNALMAKPAAFLPNPKDRETSVFRHGREPREVLWQIGREHATRERTLHGAAVVTAHSVRTALLDVIASEPPARHAAIVGWPWHDDPDMQKAQQKERAILLAQVAVLLLV